MAEDKSISKPLLFGPANNSDYSFDMIDLDEVFSGHFH